VHLFRSVSENENRKLPPHPGQRKRPRKQTQPRNVRRLSANTQGQTRIRKGCSLPLTTADHIVGVGDNASAARHRASGSNNTHSTRAVPPVEPHSPPDLPLPGDLPIPTTTPDSIGALRELFSGSVAANQLELSIGWHECTSQQLENIKLHGVCDEHVMATFIKIIQDTLLAEKWENLPESSKVGPPLLLSSQAVEALAKRFEPSTSPNVILRFSECYKSSVRIMKTVCRGVSHSEQENFEHFLHTPAYFLTVFQPLPERPITSHLQASPSNGDTNSSNDDRFDDRPRWIAVKFSIDGHIEITVTEQDKELLTTDSRYLDFLKTKLSAVWQYWSENVLVVDPHKIMWHEIPSGFDSSVFCIITLLDILVREYSNDDISILSSRPQDIVKFLYEILCNIFSVMI
jgi:hypothetical protein